MIDIICIKVDEEFDFMPYLNYFEVEIQNKIKQFYHYKDMLIAFASELVKKYYLAKYLNISPIDIDIKYTKYGKPYLTNKKVQFNISHSGDYLVVAISDTYDLGIDIEQYDCNIIPSELGQMVFSSSEQILVNNDTNKFYKLWTKKEALIKLYGDGFFSNNLQNTQLNLDNIQQLDNVVIYHNNLFNNYSFAICVMNVN